MYEAYKPRLPEVRQLRRELLRYVPKVLTILVDGLCAWLDNKLIDAKAKAAVEEALWAYKAPELPAPSPTIRKEDSGVPGLPTLTITAPYKEPQL